MDEALLAAIDDVCADARDPVQRGRDEIELLLDGWYGLLGVAPPARVLWARDPSEIRPLLAALRAAAAVRNTGETLDVVEVSLAVEAFSAHLAPARLPEIVEAAHIGSGALSSLADLHAQATHAALSDLIDEVGLDIVIQVHERTHNAAGSMHAERVEMLGGLLRWSEDADDEGFWPLSLSSLTPELIAVLSDHGARAAHTWRRWMKLMRSVLGVWAFHEVAVICPRPLEAAVDAQGRTHREDGPALRWESGWDVHAWHGTAIPPENLTVERGARGVHGVFGIRNAEHRRCAIERIGWDVIIAALDLRPTSPPVPDPGNPGFALELYRVPSSVLDAGVRRILLCTNGSPERDGTRRRYGIEVPPWFDDPLAAVAWTFGLDPQRYRLLGAAT